MYRIMYEGNIYKRLKELDADEEWFDFSNYSCDHQNFSRRNHLVPGNWKKNIQHHHHYLLTKQWYHQNNHLIFLIFYLILHIKTMLI